MVQRSLRELTMISLNKAIYGLLCAVVLSSCTTPKAALNKKANLLVDQEIHEQNIPGIAVTVIKNGKVQLNEGYGYARLNDSVKVDPSNTLFRVASISKSMTSALMIALQKEGKLHLDSSVARYIPKYLEGKSDFTVRQLGGHLAGIRSYKNKEFYSNIPYQSTSEAIEVFIHDPLKHEPGSKYLYSSYGWNLLSVVCEYAGGSPYLDLMREKVFGPYELSHTYPNTKVAEKAHQQNDRTGYYRLTDGKITEEPEVDLSNKWAGGGFESTSEDVARFAQKFWFSEMISNDLRTDYTTPQKTDDGKSTKYGVAWVSGVDDKGRQWYGHAGGGVGAKAMMIVYPEEELVIVVLSNCSNAKLREIYFGLADIYTKN